MTRVPWVGVVGCLIGITGGCGVDGDASGEVDGVLQRLRFPGVPSSRSFDSGVQR